MYIDSGAESRSLNWGLERAFSGFGLEGVKRNIVVTRAANRLKRSEATTIQSARSSYSLPVDGSIRPAISLSFLSSFERI